MSLNLILFAEERCPGKAICNLAMSKLNVNAAMILKWNEFEICFSLIEVLLHFPLGGQNAAVFVAKAVAVIDDTSHLNVGKREGLDVDSDATAFDDCFVEGLALKVHHCSVGMHGSAADIGDAETAPKIR